MFTSMRQACLAGMTLCAAAAVQAQAPYPAQPVRMIVPYAPGGASDVLARRLAAGAGAVLGQSIVVDNRPGGATVPGTGAVASARPNGYTVGLVDSAFLINPALLGDKLPYDTEKDFRAVVLVASAPVVLAVNSGVPARSVAELVALARQRPGALNFSSAGNGTALHLAGEQFKLAARVDMTHVPYKGGAPSTMAAVSGETQVIFSAPSTVQPHIQSGRLRPLAVTGERRLAMWPDVPTFKELQLDDVDASVSFGVVAPAAMSDADVGTLHAALARQLASADMSRVVRDLGFEPGGGAPAVYADLIRREIARWKRVVTQAGVKPD